MSTEIKSKNVVDAAIDALNELLPAENAVGKESEIILLGPDGILDSMSFVNFLVAIDEELARQVGVNASLADELGANWEGSLTVQDVQKLVSRLIEKAGTNK